MIYTDLAAKEKNDHKFEKLLINLRDGAELRRHPAQIPYLPNTLFSIVRNTTYATALKVNASSKPTSPP